MGGIVPLIVRRLPYLSEEVGWNLPLAAAAVEVQPLAANEGGQKDLQIRRLSLRSREEVGLPAGRHHPQVADEHLEGPHLVGGDLPDLDEVVGLDDELVFAGNDHGRETGRKSDLVPDEVGVRGRPLPGESEVVVPAGEFQPEGGLRGREALHDDVAVVGNVVVTVVREMAVAGREAQGENDYENVEMFHENSSLGALRRPVLLG